MRQQAEVLMDADLAAFLTDDSELDARVHVLDDTAAEQALRLGIIEVAAIITIVAESAIIAEKLLKVARRIKEWMQARRVSSLRLVVRGMSEDSLAEVTSATEPSELRDTLILGVYQAPSDDAL